MKQEAEQLSLFDLDLWSGKTCLGHSAQTKAKTLGLSLKKQPKSQIKAPLFLDLRGGGEQAAVYWEEGGVLLGEYAMHSFGECPSDVVASHLSQILEDTPHPKYSLSAKACAGILRRAERRGKKLPPELEAALLARLEALMEANHGEILRTDFVLREEGGRLTVTLLAECREEIGRTVERPGETGRRPGGAE